MWRGDSHYGRVEGMEWAEDNGVDYIFGLAGNTTLDALVAAPPVADWGVSHPSDALRICYPIRYPSWGI